MTAYRFCRTDDIPLLVDALNRCWAPYFPDEPLETPATFKRTIRNLQVWCSSCLVAFAGSEPIGVLIGAKRPSATLVQKIAVHPDHARQGHARHLLDSLASKLAILGPPRIVAEVPEVLAAGSALFTAAGYVQETVLTDYVLEGSDAATRPASLAGLQDGRFVVPVTVDDIVANGLCTAGRPSGWARSLESLIARKDEIAGLAVASDERIESYLLYADGGSRVPEDAGPADSRAGRSTPAAAGVLSVGARVEDGGAGLAQLISYLQARGLTAFRFPRVHPDEIPSEMLATLGFRPVATHRLHAARARAPY